MQKLLETNTVPPNGFCYWQSETRTNIVAPDYDNLFVLVAKHRKANNIPIGPLWQAEVEDQLCQKLPPGLCKEEHPANNRRNVLARVGWDDVSRGTQSLTSWLAHGKKYVDQALAESRAATCSRCYFNVAIGGLCGSCQHLHNLVTKLVGGHKTNADPFLKACAICKCANAAHVHVPVEDLAAGVTIEMMGQWPSFCWKGQELREFFGKNETVR